MTIIAIRVTIRNKYMKYSIIQLIFLIIGLSVTVYNALVQGSFIIPTSLSDAAIVLY